MPTIGRMEKAGRLRVFSPMFEEDEIPVSTLFCSYEEMPEIERKALDMVKGKTLDARYLATGIILLD